MVLVLVEVITGLGVGVGVKSLDFPGFILYLTANLCARWATRRVVDQDSCLSCISAARVCRACLVCVPSVSGVHVVYVSQVSCVYHLRLVSEHADVW